MNCYVDNVILTVEEPVEEIYIDTNRLFKEQNMNIREFMSNSEELMEMVEPEDRSTEDHPKILGIPWDTKKDILQVVCEVKPKENKSTKSEVSRIIGSIYDPLGLLLPLTLPMKLFLRKIWESGKSWDEALDEAETKEWDSIVEKTSGFSKEVPRQVMSKIGPKRLVVFTDANVNATAACAYAVDDDESHIVRAKQKLIPKGEVWTVPKSEMAAIKMVMELAKEVCLEIVNGKGSWPEVLILSDSTAALGWIKNSPGRKELGTFVCNRLRDVKKMTQELKDSGANVKFGHVQTHENMADVATRGVDKTTLMTHEWWTGPKFLTNDDIFERAEWFTIEDRDEDVVRKVFAVRKQIEMFEPVFDSDERKDLLFVKKVGSYVIRFLKKTMKRLPEQRRIDIESKIPELKIKDWTGELMPSELKNAECLLIRDNQKLWDQKRLREVKNLKIELDTQGILRCRGRLEKWDQHKERKFPILVKEHSKLASWIINEAHGNYHASTGHTMSNVRDKYWISKLRSQVKKLKSKCVRCQKLGKLPYKYPEMKDLPECRVKQSRAFESVGIDYFGPLKYKSKDDEVQKGYGLLMTCASTRMVYLDLTEDLSTGAFLNALRRFISIWDVPKRIVSDNAPQFGLVRSKVPYVVYDPETDPKKRYGLRVRILNRDFNEALLDSKTGYYQEFTKNVTGAIDQLLAKRWKGMRVSKIVGYEKGSVIAEFEVVATEDTAKIMEVRSMIEENSVRGPISGFSIEPSTVKVTEIDTSTQVSEEDILNDWSMWRNIVVIALCSIFMLVCVSLICCLLCRCRRRTTYSAYPVADAHLSYGARMMGEKAGFDNAMYHQPQRFYSQTTVASTKLSGSETAVEPPPGIVGETTYQEWYSKVGSKPASQQHEEVPIDVPVPPPAPSSVNVAPNGSSSRPPSTTPYVSYPNDPTGYYTLGGRNRHNSGGATSNKYAKQY